MNRRLTALGTLLLLAVAAGAASPPPASPAAAPTATPAARGAAFFRAKGADWSCTTCHTEDPRRTGRHVVTGKAIEPMAPAVNPRRLTDAAKVEKWFRRNCRDVLDRECTAAEKADVVAYLRSVGR